jgi:hypothetical protein
MANRKQDPVDQDSALDLLMRNTADLIRQLLGRYELPTSGTKPELRARIEDALAKRSIRVNDIIEYVDELDGWGDQHVYLYSAPEGLLPVWRSESSVREILRGARKLSLLNAHTPVVLPSVPKLSRIAWTPKHLRFVWITSRKWDERIERDDKREGLKHWKAYEERTARGVLAFDWNLLNGEAMLMIERLPSGNDYGTARDALAKELRPFLDLSLFSPVDVGRAIKNIEKSTQVRNRVLALQSARGTRVRFTSRSRKQDAFERDPDAKRSRDGLGESVSGDVGNFYWKQDGPMTDDLHTTIYASEGRIGIFGQRQEAEVRYVIQRIRNSC